MMDYARDSLQFDWSSDRRLPNENVKRPRYHASTPETYVTRFTRLYRLDAFMMTEVCDTLTYLWIETFFADLTW